MRVGSNGAALAKKYRQRIQRMDAALLRGMKKAAAAVDRAQGKNLSGSGADAAGAYPVPVRSGNLRGSTFINVSSGKLAIVGNTAEYALAIHRERAFLDDAVASTDVVGIMAIDVRKAIHA